MPLWLTACIVIGVDCAVDRLAGADTVVVVAVGDGISTAAGADQIPALGPVEGPPGTVVVADGVSIGRSLYSHGNRDSRENT